MTSNINYKELFSLKLSGQLKGWTLGEFLRDCLITLLKETEEFSGKRPICDSGWESDIALALVDAGYTPGTVVRDEDGYIDELDYRWKDVIAVLKPAINHLFEENK
jgi:hypothetical protein